jgi:hypothetical protein
VEQISRLKRAATEWESIALRTGPSLELGREHGGLLGLESSAPAVAKRLQARGSFRSKHVELIHPEEYLALRQHYGFVDDLAPSATELLAFRSAVEAAGSDHIGDIIEAIGRDSLQCIAAKIYPPYLIRGPTQSGYGNSDLLHLVKVEATEAGRIGQKSKGSSRRHAEEDGSHADPAKSVTDLYVSQYRKEKMAANHLGAGASCPTLLFVAPPGQAIPSPMQTSPIETAAYRLVVIGQSPTRHGLSWTTVPPICAVCWSEQIVAEADASIQYHGKSLNIVLLRGNAAFPAEFLGTVSLSSSNAPDAGPVAPQRSRRSGTRTAKDVDKFELFGVDSSFRTGRILMMVYAHVAQTRNPLQDVPIALYFRGKQVIGTLEHIGIRAGDTVYIREPGSQFESNGDIRRDVQTDDAMFGFGESRSGNLGFGGTAFLDIVDATPSSKPMGKDGTLQLKDNDSVSMVDNGVRSWEIDAATSSPKERQISSTGPGKPSRTWICAACTFECKLSNRGRKNVCEMCGSDMPVDHLRRE